MDEKMIGYELAKISNFVVFVPDGDKVHISEWYGYDIYRKKKVSRESARCEWKRLKNEGYKIEREVKVGRQYLGLAQ